MTKKEPNLLSIYRSLVIGYNILFLRLIIAKEYYKNNSDTTRMVAKAFGIQKRNLGSSEQDFILSSVEANLSVNN